METWEIKVCGDVQGVGFRPTVKSIARRLGITGEIRNDGRDKSLIFIIASGDAVQLKRFRIQSA